MQVDVELALDAKAILGEGPAWDDRTGELVWVDIASYEVHRFDPETGGDRSWPVGQMVGAAAPRERGGFVLALQDGFALLDDASPEPVFVESETRARGIRMNDGKCDAAGRFYAGTMAYDLTPGAAAFYRLDPDYRVTTMVSPMTLSNGLGWSPDNRTMYLIDSLEHWLDAFDFDLETGSMTGRRRLVEFPVAHGLADGMAVDADGFLWVAMYGGGAIRRFAPDGSPVGEIELPVSQPTACAFGGSDLRELYITTTRQGKSDEELALEPSLGGIFRCRPGVAGLPVNRFAG
jgi:sugar lactone lactonase YvrE